MQGDPRLKIPGPLWQDLLAGLHRRTEGYHESGAFLLGHVTDEARLVERVIYYDDLDRNAYNSGVVVMHAASFGPLWDFCRAQGLSVVADVHVHPKTAFQSFADKTNPMIALPGHLALIVPYYARPPVSLRSLGFFEYRGRHRWRNLGGLRIGRFLHIEA